MKVTKLTVHNIGPIADVAITLDKPLILFYGEICQGKTTILNAVRWVMGGAFPADIIRHGEQEAFIQLDFDGGFVRREFYIGRDGSHKAREIELQRDGKPVSNPVKELKAFLNPFLLNQDYLRDMTGPERKRFFISALGADTAEIDTKLAAAEQAASNLRAKISGYGQIDLTPQPRVDVGAIQTQIKQSVDAAELTKAELRKQINEMRDQENVARATLRDAQEKSAARQREITRANGEISANSRRIAELQSQAAALELENQRIVGWLQANPPIPTPEVALPDPGHILGLEARLAEVFPFVGPLEQQLREAYAQNVRAEHFEKELARDKQRQGDEEALHQTLVAINQYRRERIAFLAGLNDKIPGLRFDETGKLTYQDTDAEMLSTSQLMHLSAAFSSLYPEGFGLDLIDRAESLGQSVFSFIEKAKREDKTILATIVGEKPATVPAEVGVFVVSNGGVK